MLASTLKPSSKRTAHLHNRLHRCRCTLPFDSRVEGTSAFAFLEDLLSCNDRVPRGLGFGSTTRRAQPSVHARSCVQFHVRYQARLIAIQPQEHKHAKLQEWCQYMTSITVVLPDLKALACNRSISLLRSAFSDFRLSRSSFRSSYDLTPPPRVASVALPRTAPGVAINGDVPDVRPFCSFNEQPRPCK